MGGDSKSSSKGKGGKGSKGQQAPKPNSLRPTVGSTPTPSSISTPTAQAPSSLSSSNTNNNSSTDSSSSANQTAGAAPAPSGNNGGKRSTQTILVNSFWVLILLLVGYTVAANSKHASMVVRQLAKMVGSPACSTCHDLSAKVELDMALFADTLENAKRAPTTKVSSAAKKAAAEILNEACPPCTGGNCGAPEKKETSSKYVNRRQQAERQEEEAQRESVVGGENLNKTMQCRQIVAAQKKRLLRYILNLTGTATPIPPLPSDLPSNSSAYRPLMAILDPYRSIPIGPSSLCFDYCEATFPSLLRSQWNAVRLVSHPSVLGTRNIVNEVWGTVLLLGVVGTLLGLILQARVRASRLRYAAALKRRRIQQWKEGGAAAEAVVSHNELQKARRHQ